MVKVIASDVRKGNVLEHEDGQLYVVLSHETFRPGKGTPTTTIIMRRITDGVKTTAVHKTTDGLEKAFVEQIKHSYLFDDGDAGLGVTPAPRHVELGGAPTGEPAPDVRTALVEHGPGALHVLVEHRPGQRARAVGLAGPTDAIARHGGCQTCARACG